MLHGQYTGIRPILYQYHSSKENKKTKWIKKREYLSIDKHFDEMIALYDKQAMDNNHRVAMLQKK